MEILSAEERQKIFDEQNRRRRERNEALFREAILLIMEAKVKVAEVTLMIEPYKKLLKKNTPHVDNPNGSFIM